MITPYEKRNIVDHSGITFEQITAAERTPLYSSVASLHRHGFFELTLVLRGSCSIFPTTAAHRLSRVTCC